jgi:nucleoside-diphosphate-sugar epimerase
MNPRKAIVFGTGPLGLWVAQTLLDRGDQVMLVNRRGRIRGSLSAPVHVIACDATDAEAVYRACQGAEVAFHCAMPPYTAWPEEFPTLTQGILGGVSRAGARLIFGDNLYMYGDTGGATITEDQPYAATGRKGKVRAEMAQMLLDAHQRGDVQIAIGRGSDFFGPRVRNAIFGEMFFQAAFAGKPANLLGNIDMPHTYTYIRDFAAALVTLSERDEALGRAWHVPNAPTITTRQMVDLFARELGRPIKVRTAGKTLITLLGLFNPFAKEIKEMMYEWEQPYIVDHSRFEAVFGTNATPHARAAKETAAWYRQQFGRASDLRTSALQ